jgi:3,4-dihydroxy 2-butanone 4-phosphate synthase / GTP cyclohydrolase II
MTPGVRLDSVERAVAEIAAGRAVVVVDDEDRENEGDLVFAAGKATPALLAFMIRWTSGFVCVAVEGATLDRLDIPMMTPHNRERMRTAFTVSVDARNGVTTGISAADRAHTIRVLADSATEPYDLVQPGHVLPLRYRNGGVLARPGHTEASVDLARLAGLTPAGVLCELVNEDGSMMRAPDLRQFADDHSLSMISIADLIRYRRRYESQVERLAQTRMPTTHGTFHAHAYRDTVTSSEHVALVMGDVTDGEPVLVRVHSECLTGDTFGSLRCDCGPQLRAAMAAVAAEGRGVVLYLRGHEGRGIGLAHKLRAYELQDAGRDTVDANLDLGLPADARDYGTGAQILADLGVRSLRLMTNNPTKLAGLEGYGLRVVDRVSLPVSPHLENIRYLRTKRDRMGHVLPNLEDELEGSPT